MKQRTVDLTIAVLACLVGFALSWPFWRRFEYWAESRAMWWVYFIVGYLMSVYVFYVFTGCVRTLFLHDRLVKLGVIKKSSEQDDKAGAK